LNIPAVVHTSPHNQRSNACRCAWFLVALILASGQFAHASWNVDWQRWDIFSHLQNDGSVHITQTMSVRLNGSVTSLELRFATSTDQTIEIKKFVQTEEPEAIEFTPGSDEGNHYVWRDNTLSWSVKPPNGVDWEEKIVGFRLEYELRNAMAPIWDIPAGASTFKSRSQFPQFMERFRGVFNGWRQAAQGLDRRFRYDHDVLFARFPATGPVELNYTFKYDDAWLNRTPDAPLGRATPEVDYRVTEIRDYLSPGWPSAIQVWRPAVRVGSIAAFILLALALWLIFFAGEVRRRGLIGQRIDRNWFLQNILSLPPEVVACDAKTTGCVSLFRVFLHHMRARGVLSLQEGGGSGADDEPIFHLRLVRDDPGLRPFARTFLQKLFPNGSREIDSAEFARIHSKEGFDPDEELEDEIDFDDEIAPTRSSAGPSRFWGLVRSLAPVLFVTSLVAVVIEAFQQVSPDFIKVAFVAAICLGAVPFLPAFFRRHKSGVVGGLLTLIPIVFVVLGIILFHLIGTLPLGPVGSVGIAVFGLWCVAAMLQIVRSGDDVWSNSKVTSSQLAQDYVKDELKQSNPALDDDWMPHLVALGCYEAVDAWRQRRLSGMSPIPAPLAPGQLPSMQSLRPFVGDLSSVPKEEWADAFYVLSDEERKEWEEEEDEGEEGPR
jgi:hypothetical protein